MQKISFSFLLLTISIITKYAKKLKKLKNKLEKYNRIYVENH